MLIIIIISTYFSAATGHVFTISWRCVNRDNMLQKIWCDTYVNYFIVLLIFTYLISTRHQMIARLLNANYERKSWTVTAHFCKIQDIPQALKPMTPCSNHSSAIIAMQLQRKTNYTITVDFYMVIKLYARLIRIVNYTKLQVFNIVRGCMCVHGSIRTKTLKIESLLATIMQMHTNAGD